MNNSPKNPRQKIARHRIPEKSYEKARQLRREMTKPEKIMWRCLREQEPATGLTFRRQQPIHPYTVDFVCLKIKLVIELDGESHDVRVKEDERRDAYLGKLGYCTLRFSNDEVMNNLDGVNQTIIVKSNELVGKSTRYTS